jgi:predicted HTH domain antitoxin
MEAITMNKTVQLNLRIDARLAQELAHIADRENLRKTDVARRYLIDGVKNWRLQNSISRYQQGQVSLERAAVDAGLSLYEMMDELRRQGISLDRTTPEEARKQVRELLVELVSTSRG